jgi:hypothetical protein
MLNHHAITNYPSNCRAPRRVHAAREEDRKLAAQDPATGDAMRTFAWRLGQRKRRPHGNGGSGEH